MNNLITLQISGKDVKRFIRSLYKRNIRFYNIDFSNRSAIVTVSYNDYLVLKEIKTIYEIRVLKYKGFIGILKFVSMYKLFIISIIFAIALLYFLGNVIFEVEVIHDKKEMRDFVLERLDEYDIKKFSFVKSFEENEKIVADILKEHKNKIEWMEIERIGVKYIVKLEERKTIDEENNEKIGDIVAKKKGTILSVTARSGEVIKKVNDYVEAGDVIISGTIRKNDEIRDYVRADGQVFAETWYHVEVEIPLLYKEITKTNNKNKALTINFLNFKKRFFSDFKDYEATEIFKIGSSLLPISISYNLEEEVDNKEVLYTYENAVLKAREIAREKLLSKLGENDEIIYEKSLKIYEEDSKIISEMFFKVKEDITSFMEITEETENKEEKQE